MLKDGILIETKRLRFRPWADSDAEALFKYASDPDVGPRAGWPPHQSVEESRKVIRDIFSNGHTWALELKATGELAAYLQRTGFKWRFGYAAISLIPVR